MTNNIDAPFCKSRKLTKSACSQRGGNLWCLLNPAQPEDYRSADAAMALKGISSAGGRGKVGKIAGLGVPWWALKARESFTIHEKVTCAAGPASSWQQPPG